MREVLKNSRELRKACLKNAKALLRVSISLLKRKMYNLSTFLAITSYEESLKVTLLRLLEGAHISETDFNSYWRHHDNKFRTGNSAIIMIVDEKGKLQYKLNLGSATESKEIRKMRENCLYVDFLGNGINQPKDITIADATIFINKAHSELRSAESLEQLGKKLNKYFRIKPTKN